MNKRTRIPSLVSRYWEKNLEARDLKVLEHFEGLAGRY